MDKQLFRRMAAAAGTAAICLAMAACGENDKVGTACEGRDSNATYDWPSYISLEDMEEQAAAVHYVRILGCSASKGSDAGYDTTIRAEVLGSIAGGAEGGKAADKDSQTEIKGYTAPDDALPLTVGNTYVMFVNKLGYQLTPSQSTFPVDDETTKDATTSVNHSGTMSLTDDLAARLGIIEEVVPRTDEERRWKQIVDRAIGRDSINGIDDDIEGMTVSASWWSAPRTAADGTVVQPRSPGISSLSPWPAGVYTLTVYCMGEGSFDYEFTQGNRTSRQTLTCTTDALAQTDFTITTVDEHEVSTIQFTPAEDTRAAAGFAAIRSDE